MTPISSIFDPQNADARPSPVSKRGAMGKDEFLRLLVTQLSNQDPLNPADGAEFAAQLAQFTSVEQLTNIGKTLSANGEMNGMLAQSINSGVAAGLIGKQVEAAGSQIGWNGTDPAELGFELASPSATTQLTIRNAAGSIVHTQDLGGFGAGRHTATWDGRTASGVPMPEGSYTFEITATDRQQTVVDARTYTRGRVDRVTFGQDGISLWVAGAAIPMSHVRSVE